MDINRFFLVLGQVILIFTFVFLSIDNDFVKDRFDYIYVIDEEVVVYLVSYAWEILRIRL